MLLKQTIYLDIVSGSFRVDVRGVDVVVAAVVVRVVLRQLAFPAANDHPVPAADDAAGQRSKNGNRKMK